MKNKMQRRGFSLWEIIGVFALIMLGAAIVFPIVARRNGNPGRIPSCQYNLKQLGIALTQYQQDYDEHYPLLVGVSESTAIGSSSVVPPKCYGWADALWPYTKSQQIFQCPTQPHKLDTAKPFAPTERGFTDYWLNSNLNGLSFKNVSAVPAKIIMVGDGNDGGDLTDARYNLPALPAAWIKDQNSPAYRHNGMANYAFLDGHVKAFSPAQITNESADKGKPTFAVK